MEIYFQTELKKVAEDSDVYRQLQTQYEQYQSQYNDIVEAQKQRSEAFQRAVADAVEHGRKAAIVKIYAPRSVPKKDKAYWQRYTERIHQLVQTSQ
ncbi:MAG: hypothetical protein K9N55_20625 [Phycisphaerae bacterium]|nr:hypothetical protein [Phycisphaerae bacterium]